MLNNARNTVKILDLCTIFFNINLKDRIDLVFLQQLLFGHEDQKWDFGKIKLDVNNINFNCKLIYNKVVTVNAIPIQNKSITACTVDNNSDYTNNYCFSLLLNYNHLLSIFYARTPAIQVEVRYQSIMLFFFALQHAYFDYITI